MCIDRRNARDFGLPSTEIDILEKIDEIIGKNFPHLLDVEIEPGISLKNDFNLSLIDLKKIITEIEKEFNFTAYILENEYEDLMDIHTLIQFVDLST